MAIDWDRLKSAVKIEDVVREDFPNLAGRGKYMSPAKGTKEGALVVNVDRQLYYWNARGTRGSVIDYLINERNMELMAAGRWLADRAGIEWEVSPEEAARLAVVAHKRGIMTRLVQHFQGRLVAPELVDGVLDGSVGYEAVVQHWRDAGRDLNAAAVEYALGRGWTCESLIREGVGFWDRDVAGLDGWLNLHGIALDEPAVVAVRGFTPAGDDSLPLWAERYELVGLRSNWIANNRVAGFWQDGLIYSTGRRGEVDYFALRAIRSDAKAKMLNPEAELVGERLPFFNSCAERDGQVVVVVEGQADAVTLGQWGIAACALAGLSGEVEGLVERLGRFERRVIWLDADAAANEAMEEGRPMARLVAALGLETGVVSNPGVVNEGAPNKDVNDWARFQGGDGRQALELVAAARPFPVWLAGRVGEADALGATGLQKRVIDLFAELPELERERWRKDVAKDAGLNLTMLDRMVRALVRKAKEAVREAVKRERSTDNTEFSVGGFKRDENGDAWLFEMIYRGEEHEEGTSTAFVVRNPNGELSVERSITVNGRTYLPFPAWHTFFSMGAMRIADGWQDYGSEMDLHVSAREIIYKYCALPEDIEELAAFYVQMTWMSDLLTTVPYLRGLGDYGTGKTRFINVVGNMCWRPVFFTGGSSTASMFRTMDLFDQITLVMNEADFDKSDASNEKVSIFNNGHEKGFYVMRVDDMRDPESGIQMMLPRPFPVYGCKLVSQRFAFQDQATNSRFITWEATGGIALPERIPMVIDPREFEREVMVVRRKMLKYRMDRFDPDMEIDYKAGDPKLPGRLRQISVAMKAVAPQMEEPINVFMRKQRSQMLAEMGDRLEAKVLLALLQCYFMPDQGVDEDAALTMKEICKRTNRMLDNENDVDDESAGRDRKALRPVSIGNLVRKKLNLATKKTRFGSQVEWDDKRVADLCDRWGLSDRYNKFVADGRIRQDSERESQEVLDL